VQRRDLVLMKNDDDCLCWEATLGALISHAICLCEWLLGIARARSLAFCSAHINKHIYQGSDARGVSCLGASASGPLWEMLTYVLIWRKWIAHMEKVIPR
jgi:hypothetical protein